MLGHQNWVLHSSCAWIGWYDSPFCTGSLILKQALLGLFMWWEEGLQSEMRSRGASRGLGLEVAQLPLPWYSIDRASDKLAQVQEMGK